MHLTVISTAVQFVCARAYSGEYFGHVKCMDNDRFPALLLHGLFLTYRTDSSDYLTISGFTPLNGLICLHSVLDKAGSQSVFKRT